MGHSPINNSDPRIIVLGLFVAALCAVLGAIAFIHFRDRASHDDGQYDRYETQSSGTGGSNVVGGIRLIFLCSVLGCAVFYWMKSEPQREQLIQQVSDAIGVNVSKGSSRDSMQRLPIRGYPAEWLNHQWTADEAPYLEIRNEVDSQMTTDEKSARVAQQMREAALSHSDDPLVMYRWGYAAYKLAYRACYHSTSKQRNEIVQGGDQDARQIEIAECIDDADYQMQRVPNPQSYSFSRQLFLLCSMRQFTRQHIPPAEFALIIQGEYLISYKPDDWDVKEAQARMLATRHQLMEKERAFQYAQDVVHARPKSPQAWQALGIVYVAFAPPKKNDPKVRSEYITKAIKAYQKCLQLAPPDYGPRENLEKAIPTIREHMQFH